MFDWVKSWFANGKTVIYINEVIFPPCGCCHKPTPVAPTKPILFPGDAYMAIKFPVSVPPGAPDVVKTSVTFTVEGQPSTTVDIAGNGGSTDIVVPEGSNGVVSAKYFAAAGNPSLPSPEATWTNASDTTPPAAPQGAPVLGAGDTV